MLAQRRAGAVGFSLQMADGNISYLAIENGSQSEKVKLRFVLTSSNSGAVVFSLELGRFSVGCLAIENFIFEICSSIRFRLKCDNVVYYTISYIEVYSSMQYQY